MAHIRQSIRDNAVTAVTGLSTTGSNVFRSRVYQLGTNKLPALCVYTDSEVVEYNRLDRVRDVDRTVDIVIEAYVTGLNYVAVWPSVSPLRACEASV